MTSLCVVGAEIFHVNCGYNLQKAMFLSTLNGHNSRTTWARDLEGMKIHFSHQIYKCANFQENGQCYFLNITLINSGWSDMEWPVTIEEDRPELLLGLLDFFILWTLYFIPFSLLCACLLSLFPIWKCLGESTCMSSTFSIAMQNLTFYFFCSVKQLLVL